RSPRTPKHEQSTGPRHERAIRLVAASSTGICPRGEAAHLTPHPTRADAPFASLVGYPRTFLDKIDGRARVSADPIWDAISAGGPLFVSSAVEYAARFPEMAHLLAVVDTLDVGAAVRSIRGSYRHGRADWVIRTAHH
ncbi:hypothetical protein ACFRC1_38780, partial [Streptomyces sp. NPDC056626]|uniref:hypothetical protein n=1 Tax=Streptomyces sp. NPDC056626 TaxID=3345880 RepID=UPI00369A0E69